MPYNCYRFANPADALQYFGVSRLCELHVIIEKHKKAIISRREGRREAWDYEIRKRGNDGMKEIMKN